MTRSRWRAVSGARSSKRTGDRKSCGAGLGPTGRPRCQGQLLALLGAVTLTAYRVELPGV